ncbi:tryptophan synthase subunit alpha [Rubricoccus marinus]|uniref:Tryptophan synthase alpha chain n=1 Tax=Rubricoccus marinus TaxID=716817 RepID=A0A259TXW1_9BACT|nr:tryptophan synthase subunit alpha [Rubricoccus marinus]OZC02613.1 tryptophan synthase subunit alpha [Rubricoccus marinus]
MNRLRSTLDALRDRGETALGLFLTAGTPTPEATLDILLAAAEGTEASGGADFIELGMPFSDPVAEGLPIQQASERALAAGMTMDGVFDIARGLRQQSDVPLALMGYANPVLRYGVSDFCAAAKSAGVDGLILPDLPPEESDELDEAAAHHDLTTVYLVAPNTAPDRVALVTERATGFVYAVSQAGLTGAELADAEITAAYLARTREAIHARGLPMCVGFGIRTADDAARLGKEADGVIVGSALIRLADRLWREEMSPEARLAEIRDWATTLKNGATRHDA